MIFRRTAPLSSLYGSRLYLDLTHALSAQQATERFCPGEVIPDHVNGLILGIVVEVRVTRRPVVDEWDDPRRQPVSSITLVLERPWLKDRNWLEDELFPRLTLK